ncbi:class I SAM-dependent methyltransferase [Methylobacterium sp. 77]|uniref:class I SAM-dependent methyltransferase n=1 Tax=Methylobacterium sp. 77 TaxID=1101192 RepID=UPI00036F3DA8|nr:class I SAM-dependent methyltransferase [Methylobacterium sp. 77]
MDKASPPQKIASLTCQDPDDAVAKAPRQSRHTENVTTIGSSADARDGALFEARIACPVCGSIHSATLFTAGYEAPQVRRHVESHYRNQGTVNCDILKGFDYTIMECPNCELIYQKNTPSDRMLSVIYDQFIDPDKLKRFEFDRLTADNFQDVSRRLIDLLAILGKEPKDVSLLDFGFGYGRWARVAVGMGMSVYATEISPEKIAFARSIGVTILTDAELKNRRFDIVHTEQVFEHLTDPVAVFDMLADCVAEGGLFKIAVPRQGRIRDLLRKNGFIDWSPFEFDFQRRRRFNDYNTILPLEHVNSFSRKSVEVLASRAGMTVTVGRFGGHHIDVDVGSYRSFGRSLRLLGIRLLKDLYVNLGPGRRDSGYYILRKEA